MALFVAFGLPGWWRITSNLYEAQLTLETPAPAPAAPGAAAKSAAEPVQNLEKLIGTALDHEWKNALAFAPRSAPVLELRKLNPTTHALLCRGPTPASATERCEELATKAAEGGGVRVLPSQTPPSRAITFARLPVFLVGAGFGLSAGVLWMLALGLFVARQRPQPLNAAVLIPSSIPPERLASEPPPGTWRFTIWPPAPEAPAGSSSTLRPICDELTMRAGERCFVVGVTCSPDSRARKARVAAELAIELSEERAPRILLLEADFEEPALELTMRINVPPLAGFSQQLHLREEPLQHTSWAVVHCSTHLSVLAEGRVRVPGMLHSERFALALSQLRLDYDIIVIDGPPLGNVKDARALDAVTDGIVFVAASTAHAAGTHNAATKWFGPKRLSTLVLADPSDA